jgi:hypothetical protein
MIVDVLQNVFGAIGALLVAGGGGAVVTWLFIKLFAEGWLNSKFERQLQTYKHAQEREIEELRFRINSMFDRKTKLHQQEFEIVPEAWSRLVEAHAQVNAFTSFLQSYPDLSRMNPTQREEFLKESKLANWQQSELMASSDKNKYYQKAIFFHRSSECRNKCRELHVYTKSKGIFLPEDIRDAFIKLDGIIWNALIEHEINEEEEIRPRERSSMIVFDSTGKQLLDEIESLVRRRLWEDADLKSTAL